MLPRVIVRLTLRFIKDLVVTEKPLPLQPDPTEDRQHPQRQAFPLRPEDCVKVWLDIETKRAAVVEENGELIGEAGTRTICIGTRTFLVGTRTFGVGSMAGCISKRIMWVGAQSAGVSARFVHNDTRFLWLDVRMVCRQHADHLYQ